MVELHQTEVDGVPCFRVESHRPTLGASLIFRVGQGDETFATRGLLHLLEHACLHGRGGGALEINGSVNLLTTSFDAHGPVERVAGHLSDISRWLTDPDFRALEHERQVLRAED